MAKKIKLEGRVHPDFSNEQLVLLANELLFRAELALPGDSEIVEGLRWGLASTQFRARTGMTLTQFYLKL